ncbi:MAG: ATP-binding protein [Roseburia sp.]|nr:ATP-binding protein [Roseburia sp.]MCM1277995.1 ATP-binding protein [Robinsoniella sp.]
MNGIQWNILYVLIHFSEIYLYYWFFCENLHKHFTGAKKWLWLVFFTIFMAAADTLDINPILKLCCMFMLGCLFAAWIYKASLAVSILLNSLFFFTVIASEILVGGLLLMFYGKTDISFLIQEPFLRIQCISFSKLLNFILIVLCIRLLNGKKEKYTGKETVILLLQTVASILCLLVIVESAYSHKEGFGLRMLLLEISALVIIVSYFVFYYLIDGYFAYRIREKDFLLMDMRNEKMMANYAQIEKNQQNVHRLYHDLKKHINTMLLFENSEETEQYIEELFQNIREVNGEFQTGNHFVDAILYDEWKKAVDAGIRVQFAVEPGSFDSIDLSDVTVILGNALENAREACLKRVANGKSAYMQLKAMKQDQQLLIVASNEFDGQVLQKNNVLLSSKEDKYLHGIGMKSIQTTVEKYHGSMKVSVKENKFKLMLMLCLDSD